MRGIGFAGRGKAGKTTAATYLATTHAAEILSFASPLKLDLAFWLARLDADRWSPPGGSSAAKHENRERYYAERFTYYQRTMLGASTPEKEAIRPLMQEYGEYRRSQDEDYWVRFVEAVLMQERTDTPLYTFDDIRHPNECDMLRRQRIYVIRLTRPGVSTVSNSGHISEVAVNRLEVDLEVVNDAPLETLYAFLDLVVDTLRLGNLDPRPPGEPTPMQLLSAFNQEALS